jgi:hypothetical protein
VQGKVKPNGQGVEPEVGLEPTTCGLRNRHTRFSQGYRRVPNLSVLAGRTAIRAVAVRLGDAAETPVCRRRCGQGVGKSPSQIGLLRESRWGFAIEMMASTSASILCGASPAFTYCCDPAAVAGDCSAWLT